MNCPAAYESEFGVELEQAAVFVLKAHDLNADALGALGVQSAASHPGPGS